MTKLLCIPAFAAICTIYVLLAFHLWISGAPKECWEVVFAEGRTR